MCYVKINNKLVSVYSVTYIFTLYWKFICRKSSNRCITVIRQQAGSVAASSVLEVTMNSRQQMVVLMQRCPLTSKERHDLVPRTEKSLNTQGMRKTNNSFST